MKTLIRHGCVVTPTGVKSLDLLIEGERIAALEPPGTITGADCILDAKGCYILPGFIDFHVHLDDRIGKFELADTYQSGSEVAILNGITSLCSFVTQGPGETLIKACHRALSKAEGNTFCDLHWHLTPTHFDEATWSEIDALIERGWTTFKFYTTYRQAGLFTSYDHLDSHFARLTPKGVRFLIHCEDDALLSGIAHHKLDLTKANTHASLRPAQAEWQSIEHVLDIARRHSAMVHVVHVSSVEGAQLMARQASEGPFTCETCPQYLWLDESYLERPDGHRWICSPPLRNQREAFRELARHGAFSLFATDHCAFTRRDKDDWDQRSVRTVANGLAGLGALPHLVWKLFEADSDTAATELAKRLSRTPAMLAGMKHKGEIRVGADADLVVLNPYGLERPIRSSVSDVYESYSGFTSTLAIKAVLLRGELAVQNDSLVPSATPKGLVLHPL